MNTLKSLYSVGLIKLSLVQQISVQNSNRSNAKIIIYQYLHMGMF
jgi:hypothetical protein